MQAPRRLSLLGTGVILSGKTGLEVVELGPDLSVSPDVGLEVGMPVMLLPDVGLEVEMPVMLLPDVDPVVGNSVNVALPEVGVLIMVLSIVDTVDPNPKFN